jgi:hypothetical protein
MSKARDMQVLAVDAEVVTSRLWVLSAPATISSRISRCPAIVEMARLPHSAKIKMILGSLERSTCCPPGRPSFKSLHNRGAPALAPRAGEDAPMHCTSSTSNQWKKMSILMK